MVNIGELSAALSLDFSAFVNGFKSAADSIGKQVDNLDKAMAGAFERSDNLFTGFEKFGDSARDIGTSLTGWVTLPIIGAGAAAIKLGNDIRTAEIAFETMLGSGEKARAFLEELKDFAEQTPFEFPDLVQAAKRMLALGFESNEVIPMLRAVGDAAAGLGGGAETINRITLALGQMNAKGKASAEEIKQLAEAGVPAWEMLAEKIGVSVPEAMKLAEKGAISSAVAIPAIVAGMNQKFGGLMDKLSQETIGKWSNLMDKTSMMFADLGKAILPLASKLIDNFASPAINAIGKVVDAFLKLSPAMQEVIIGVAGVAAAAGPTLFAVGSLAGAFVDISRAAKAYGEIMREFPAVVNLARTALAGLGTAALVVGAAFVGMQIGEWAYQNIPGIKALNQQLSDLVYEYVPGIKGLVDRLAGVTDANKNLESIVAKNVATLKKHGIEIDRGSKSLDQYAAEVNKALREVLGLNKEHTVASTVVDTRSDAEKELQRQLDASRRALADLEAAQGRQSEVTYKSTTATEAYEIALRQVRQKISELEEAERRGYNVAAELAALRKSEGILYEGLHPKLVKHKEATIDIVAETENLAKAVGDLGPQIQTVEIDFGALANGMKNLPIPETVQAFQHLGMKSVEELERMADASQRAFEILESAGVAGAGQVRLAHIAALEDIVAVYQAKGEEVPAAQQIMLAKLTQQQRDYQENAVYGWATLWQSLRDNMSDMFATLNRTVFTGDWEGMKNRVINDLQNMGAAVLDKFLKPAQDAIANFIATSLTDLLGGNGFGGLGSMLGGIGSAVGKLFGGGGGGNAVGDAAWDSIPLISGLGGALKIPGLSNAVSTAASAVTGGASTALSGIMGSLTSVLNPIGMIGSIVGGVGSILQAFGVGSQGEKDRLNIIANNTSYLAWAFSTGGLHEAILKTKEALMYSIAPTLEWILTHASIQVGLLDPMRWDISSMAQSYPQMTAAVSDIRNMMREAISKTSMAGLTVNVTVQNSYGSTPQELAEIIEEQIVRSIRFQGV